MSASRYSSAGSTPSQAGGKFYLFGGRDFGPDKDTVVSTAGYVYDPVSGEWTQLDGKFPVMAATAVTIDNDIWFFGGVEKILPTDPDHPGFSHTLRRYTPSTGELADVCESPFPLAVTTTAVLMPEERSVIITSGEVRPGVRTPLVLCDAECDAVFVSGGCAAGRPVRGPRGCATRRGRGCWRGCRCFSRSRAGGHRR